MGIAIAKPQSVNLKNETLENISSTILNICLIEYIIKSVNSSEVIMLQLSTKGIELTINENEGVISSLKLKGKERIVATCPIFKMRFRDTDGESLFIDSTEARAVDNLTFSGFEKLPSISAKLYVYENDGINWQIHIDGVPKEYAIEWVELPTVCLPKLIDNDYKGGRILFPYDEGILLTDENSLPRYEAEFPNPRNSR